MWLIGYLVVKFEMELLLCQLLVIIVLFLVEEVVIGYLQVVQLLLVYCGLIIREGALVGKLLKTHVFSNS